MEFNLITNAGNNAREQLAQIFADTAAEVGVKVNVRPVGFGVLVEHLNATGEERGFDAVLLGLTGGDLDWPFGVNATPCGSALHAWNRPADDSCLVSQELLAEVLYYKGRRQLEFDERQRLGYKLQEVLSELQGFVQLASPSYNPTWNNRIGGHYPEEHITSLYAHALFGPRDPALTFIR